MINQLVHQADFRRDHVFRNIDSAGDVLIAGLDIVVLVRDVADQVDAASADQVGGAAVDQRGVEVVSDAVVLNHGAVRVGATVQAGAVAIGRDVVAEHAGHDNAVSELARLAEQDHLFADSGQVPVVVGSGAQCEPGKPGRSQFSGGYLHAWGPHLHGGDDAEADEVFEVAGDGGEIVHAAYGGIAYALDRCLSVVTRLFTSKRTTDHELVS